MITDLSPGLVPVPGSRPHTHASQRIQRIPCLARITRSQPAVWPGRQPELFQQGADVTILPLRTASQSCGTRPAWFRGDRHAL